MVLAQNGDRFYQLGAVLCIYNDAYLSVGSNRITIFYNNNNMLCFVLFVSFPYSAKNEFRVSCMLSKDSTTSIQSHNVLLKSKDYVCWGFVSPRFHNTVPFNRDPKCDSHDRTRGHPKSYIPEPDTSICPVSLPPQGEDPVYPN